MEYVQHVLDTKGIITAFLISINFQKGNFFMNVLDYFLFPFEWALATFAPLSLCPILLHNVSFPVCLIVKSPCLSLACLPLFHFPFSPPSGQHWHFVYEGLVSICSSLVFYRCFSSSLFGNALLSLIMKSEMDFLYTQCHTVCAFLCMCILYKLSQA